jgi:hypothetical protein
MAVTAARVGTVHARPITIREDEMSKSIDRNKHPSKDELQDETLDAVTGGTTVVTNLANMRHEMVKTVANNLRA